jgi:outer membrane immunogenic protein
MKRISLLAAALMGIAFAHSAIAADLPVRAAPVYQAPAVVAPTWTGFYLGFNGGWGWSNTSANITPFGPVAASFGGGSFSRNADGAIFGGQLGYNYQTGNWVWGVEGDFDGASINKGRASTFAPIPGSVVFNDGAAFHANVDWLATIRGRLGYTWGPGMIYITGGGAWSEFKLNALACEGIAGICGAGNFNTTRSGWVIGAGYEWMIAPNWSVRGEYLYYSFNNNNFNGNISLAPLATGSGFNVNNNKTEINVVRLGLNYKFDWWR